MAIPEFILKKLVVPGSFSKTANTFSFKMQNTFAPATINRFSVSVGENRIAENKIKLTSSVFGEVKCEEIQDTHPMIMPVGIEITIQVDEDAGNHPIRIFASTKEVGDITFGLIQEKSKRTNISFRPSLRSYFRKPPEAEIHVFSNESIGFASPFLSAHFIEHLERCIYDGIWTKNGSKLREDTLDLIRQLNPSMIRYPGGNFASGYHWEDGIGPKNKRPSRHDAAWQAEDSNQVGTDEFLAFCEEIHTEPYLVVNDGSGTPEEAARWVEYCNSEQDTDQGVRRKAHGHPEPYSVKYWGVGNEVWGPWQIGTTSAVNYSQRLLKFINAMKAVDPTIKIIAVGHNPLTDEPDDPATLWNQTVLESAGDQIDYLSWHIYQPEKSGWKDHYNQEQLFKSINAAHLDLESIINRVEAQISKWSPNHKVLQALDEWNLWLPPIEKNVSMHSVTYTMSDALYVASALSTFYKHNHSMGMANLAQMVNVLPLIQTNLESAIATAIFYPFVLFGQLPSEILNTSTVCSSFNSPKLDENVLEHFNVPYLENISGIDREKRKLSIILINRFPFEKQKVSLTLDQIESIEPVNALCLHATAPLSYNTFKNPNKIKLTDQKLPIKKGISWEFTIKPCSITLIDFQY